MDWKYNHLYLLLTINLELEICKKLDLTYNIVHYCSLINTHLSKF